MVLSVFEVQTLQNFSSSLPITPRKGTCPGASCLLEPGPLPDSVSSWCWTWGALPFPGGRFPICEMERTREPASQGVMSLMTPALPGEPGSPFQAPGLPISSPPVRIHVCAMPRPGWMDRPCRGDGGPQGRCAVCGLWDTGPWGWGRVLWVGPPIPFIAAGETEAKRWWHSGCCSKIAWRQVWH